MVNGCILLQGGLGAQPSPTPGSGSLELLPVLGLEQVVWLFPHCGRAGAGLAVPCDAGH